MSSLEDLRRTMQERADDAEPIGPATWNAGVRGKASELRRRRRAVRSGAVAFLTAAAVAVVLVAPGLVDDPRSDRRPDPAAGVLPPPTMTSLGYTYTWVESVTGTDGRAEVELSKDDGPMLVSWATSGSDDRVRVTGEDGTARTWSTPDFTQFTDVEGDGDTTVEARAAHGEVGLVVYRLSAPAPGETVAGVTFRDEVADGTLAGASFGELGDSEVSLTVTPRTGHVGVSTFCSGADASDARVDVARRGRGLFSSGGSCDAHLRDPGPWTISTRVTPGKPLTLTMSATQRVADERVPLTGDVRAGIAVYDLPRSTRVAEGSPRPDRVVEAHGHRWVLDDVRGSRPGARAVTQRVRVDETGDPVLVRMVTGPGRSRNLARASIDGRVAMQSSVGESQGEMGLVTQSGPLASVRLIGKDPRTVPLGIATYRQAD